MIKSVRSIYDQKYSMLIGLPLRVSLECVDWLNRAVSQIEHPGGLIGAAVDVVMMTRMFYFKF